MRNPFSVSNKTTFSEMPQRSAGILDDFSTRKVTETQELYITDADGTRINFKATTWDLTILNPNGCYTINPLVFLARTQFPIIVTRIRVELDATTNQVAGDLKWADDFLTLANATLIKAFDTTSGFYESGAEGIGTWYSEQIAKEKVLYLSFDSQPNSAIKEMHVHIEYKIA